MFLKCCEKRIKLELLFSKLFLKKEDKVKIFIDKEENIKRIIIKDF